MKRSVKSSLTRRDFINGMAVGAAGLHLSPLEALAQGVLPSHSLGPDYYPPALTGMRGSVDGTYEIAHALAREGRAFSLPPPKRAFCAVLLPVSAWQTIRRLS